MARPAGGVVAALQRQWWDKPDDAPMARLLQPLASLYGALSAVQRRRSSPPVALPVPVVVVGNIVVGGAGKTPTVIAVVELLRRHGWCPGVVSRGYGRRGRRVRAVEPGDDPADTGDEPLLIRRRTGAPVVVGADRVAAVRALCRAHPAVNVVVSDDGLQHRALARVVEAVVFDDRGIGNGRLLPAGPLREPLAAAASAAGGGSTTPADGGPSAILHADGGSSAMLHADGAQALATASSASGVPRLVLYTGDRVSTALPGHVARASVARAWPLAAWWQGDATAARPLSAWRGQRVRAVAGIANPAKFFAALRAHGLAIDEHPLPDHHDHRGTQWGDPQGHVLTTEKDAVKLAPEAAGRPPLWVVPLDLTLPDAFAAALLDALSRAAAGAAGAPSP